ncbi:4-(cytidine 5'-diphospho)-2-C-methyl-D-erythritol kinase [Neisseria canis]|uniref:4-diphosphocytidyl-2-C-methyl-D-erythritol kinase n=1 Tax=Neisseria canis TaxID=493 RepID=A0A1X3D0R4_9NEIS|nr:4-(cytidine 5'-diphospho)-2-C-methyl-D-erythritol kinase [Neisseria canis]OSI13510.1 4-(cytidine 5'-diphospho)-2-C-methyl-D-erythritol kinase [Neisseria canis]VEE99280.1 4-diphosphocytidyl-2-C-methyl-D-erythritol kinase [Neisseria canis]
MNLPANARTYPAPAKLNLDLRITGRRSDGYHELESIFCLVALYDTLHLAVRQDSEIVLHTPTFSVEPEHDLTVRAAKLLQKATQSKFGVDIWLEKQIPMGGGLGGGSSDAATMLLALNRLWTCGLNRQQLMDLGVQLGADVPFFIFGRNAFARGIGEKLTEIDIPKQWYVIIRPNVHVSTQKIFSHKNLTRDSKPSIIASFQALQPFRNDMQSVVFEEYPQVFTAFEDLKVHGSDPLMTGSGACVFIAVSTKEKAEIICKEVSKKYQAFCVEGLTQHPLFDI